jgi:transposase-like protein
VRPLAGGALQLVLDALARVADVLDIANGIESIHSRLRTVIKSRGHFHSDEAATKLIWPALRNIAANSIA